MVVGIELKLGVNVNGEAENRPGKLIDRTTKQATHGYPGGVEVLIVLPEMV